jgi:hypothetical protein
MPLLTDNIITEEALPKLLNMSVLDRVIDDSTDILTC